MQFILIKNLIELGSDVNYTGIFLETPLHIAAGISDRSEIVKVLIDAGANINIVFMRTRNK